jgi:hypothetical protein
MDVYKSKDGAALRFYVEARTEQRGQRKAWPPHFRRMPIRRSNRTGKPRKRTCVLA